MTANPLCHEEDFPCDDDVETTFSVTLSEIDAGFVRGAIAERGLTVAQFCAEALVHHAQW